jgi:hypothetical protein
MAKSTDTSTLVTVVSLIERAQAAERHGKHDQAVGCPSCTCCTREGCHPGLDSKCPYSTALDRVVWPLHRGLTRDLDRRP